MAWTEYSTRARLSADIERDRTTVLSFPLYRDGALAAPASGTITVYNAANQAIVDAAVVSIVASVATYSMLPATVAGEAFGGGWRIEWLLVMADTYTHCYRQDASLVRCRLAPVVVDADLTARHSDLNAQLPAGTTSWQTWLDTAWEDVVGRLEGMGRRPYLVIEPKALRPVHLYTALEIICRDLGGTGDESNKWSKLAVHYGEQVKEAWAHCGLVYDETNAGRADATRRKSAVASVWLMGGR